MKLITYNFSDLKEMKVCLERRLEESRLDVSVAEKCMDKLDQVLKAIKQPNANSEITIPEDFLCNPNTLLQTNKKVEWKKLVLTIISKSNTYLTSQMIYDKGRIQFPIESINKRDCSKSISSALSTLVSEGKIGSFKHPKTKLLNYGDLHKFFSNDGKPTLKL